MTSEMRNDIIDFYNEVLWGLGMPKVESLTDDELKPLSETLSFSTWRLRNRYDHCVNSLKIVIKRLLK